MDFTPHNDLEQEPIAVRNGDADAGVFAMTHCRATDPQLPSDDAA